MYEKLFLAFLFLAVITSFIFFKTTAATFWFWSRATYLFTLTAASTLVFLNIALTGGMTLKKLITAIIMLTAAVLLLCACTPEQTASVQPTQTQSGQTEQATPSGREFLYDKNGNVIQQPQVRDYTAMWWRDGFNRGGKWQMNMQTGYYGMSVSTLAICAYDT